MGRFPGSLQGPLGGRILGEHDVGVLAEVIVFVLPDHGEPVVVVVHESRRGSLQGSPRAWVIDLVGATDAAFPLVRRVGIGWPKWQRLVKGGRVATRAENVSLVTHGPVPR